jgi:hypothetical protein
VARGKEAAARGGGVRGGTVERQDSRGPSLHEAQPELRAALRRCYEGFSHDANPFRNNLSSSSALELIK